MTILHREFDIEQSLLDEISQELFASMEILDENFWDRYNSGVLDFENFLKRGTTDERVELVWSSLPKLKAWLATLGLSTDDLSSFVRFIITAPSDMPIHTDGNGVLNNQGTNSEAINIPIYNCQDGYTVWYDAEGYFLSPEAALAFMGEDFEQKHSPMVFKNRLAGLQTGQIYNWEGSREIGRASANKALWIKIDVPHVAENNGDKPRVIASLRFKNPLPVDTFKWRAA